VKHITGQVSLIGTWYWAHKYASIVTSPVSTSLMLDSVKRFLGRVYLIPVSVESLTHLTLSDRLIGSHLVFLLFILPPARSRLPTLLIEHMTTSTSINATSLLQRRTCGLLISDRNFVEHRTPGLLGSASIRVLLPAKASTQPPRVVSEMFTGVHGTAMQLPTRYPIYSCSLRVLTPAPGRGQIPSVFESEWRSSCQNQQGMSGIV
jgi:hypothetical protein